MDNKDLKYALCEVHYLNKVDVWVAIMSATIITSLNGNQIKNGAIQMFIGLVEFLPPMKKAEISIYLSRRVVMRSSTA